MVDFTIIIPTHNHAFALKGSIKSVLNQSNQSFNLYVIGDGQRTDTDEVMVEICKWDKRINYLPHKKGEGYGELYRHDVLQSAQSLYVAYLGDDDFWLPNHLECLKASLINHDYAHTIATEYNKSNRIDYRIDDINYPETFKLILDKKYNFFGLSCISHRLDSYKKLPHGWRPKLSNLASDQYFLIQWIETKGMTFKSIQRSTTLKLPSRARVKDDIEKRSKEFEFWMYKVNSPKYTAYNNKNFKQGFSLRQDEPHQNLLKKATYLCNTYQLHKCQQYLYKLKKIDAISKKVLALENSFQDKKKSIFFRLLKRSSNYLLRNKFQ